MTTKEEEDNAEAHIDAVQESTDIPFDEAISASYGNPNPDYEDDGNNEKGDVHVATAGVIANAEAEADADADEEHLVEGVPPPPSPYNDDISEMTYSRRLARYLSKYDWYNPSKNVKGFHAPNLDVAWEYFEHSKLPRHFIAESSLATNDQTTSQKSFHRRRNVKDILQRAEYGEEEEKTLLYSVLKTPETELGDFGIGVGIYFWTLRVLCIIAFLAGLINIPNMIYFSSDEYGDGGQLGNISKWGLLGSAACIDTKWVACPNCTKSDWDRFPRDYSRFATDSDGRSFIYKNNCQVTFDEGIVAWASFFFVMVSIMVMNFFSKYREHYIDSLSQTSSDYTVTVENPPIHATNPDEWKDFFYQIAGDDPIHVTLVTVAIDNEDLIKILVKRRKQIQNLIYLLKPGVQFEGDNLDQMANQTVDLTWVQKHLLFKKTGPELLKAIRDLEEQAKEESKKDFGASNIFITFETEKQQKMILNKLALPRSQIMADGILVPNDIKFLGKYALAVKEPAEPSSIRWHDLDESLTVQIVQRVISTTLVLIAIVLGALLVQVVKSQTDSASYAALTVTAINQITPYICKFCNRFESHSNDGSYQTSLYTKTTFFKWTNTAIVTVIITPFTYKIRDGSDYLINSVYSIFFAELLTNPAIKISDIWGNIQRHYLGPRELDQRRMNLRFGGGAFVLSDRYTEVTKILFLTFFYSSIFPAGFFFCAASLFINYWVDKFSLLRVWGPSPTVGAGVAELSRDYFFTLALLVYAIILAYFYSGFPFDNVCDTGSTVTSDYVGTFSAVTSDDAATAVEITIGSDESLYQYCLQDLLRYASNGLGTAFPAIPSYQPEGHEWMTSGQETGSSLLGWSSVAVLIITVMIIVNRSVFAILRNFFLKPKIDQGGKLSEQRFSEGKETTAYIPQVKSTVSDLPFLACDISHLNESLLDFENPMIDFPFDSTNLIYDLPELNEGDKKLFSLVNHWPPKKTIHH